MYFLLQSAIRNLKSAIGTIRNLKSAIRNRNNPQSNGRVGYLELLRSNRDFRNLWLGQVVSELGDWFSIIALFNLLLQLTNRAQSVGWFLIIIHLPSVIVGPVAGLLIDRLDRKRLMIWMDALRAVLVLGYLLVQSGASDMDRLSDGYARSCHPDGIRAGPDCAGAKYMPPARAGSG